MDGAAAAVGEALHEKGMPSLTIAGYGIMSTPALVVDEVVVMSGRVPTATQLRSLLAPLGTRSSRL